MAKQKAPQVIIDEHRRLTGIMRQSVYNVTFPFGVVGPTRRRLDEIETRYELPEAVNS